MSSPKNKASDTHDLINLVVNPIHTINMTSIVSASLTPFENEFIINNNLSPTKLLKQKIMELVKLDPKELQSKLKTMNSDGKQTKWQKAYWQCETYEQRQELMREFHKAVYK